MLNGLYDINLDMLLPHGKWYTFLKPRRVFLSPYYTVNFN